MRTDIAHHLLQDPGVKVSEEISRACVHCGFCNATCPTYLLTGNELEGPRGRIYLIKNILEKGFKPSRQTLEHIDNCLGCLACETTCPSGVDYSRLPEAATVARPGVVPAEGERRLRVALLTGCAQQVLGPQINDALVRLLTRLGAEVVIPKDMGCCGALTFHMGERKRSRKLMAHNIEVWHRELEGEGLDAIVLNTSGCGTAVREYDYIFRHDPKLADKARVVTERVRDISEVVADLGLGEAQEATGLKVAYHDACSLQHGQKVKDAPRQLLRAAGFEVVEVPEAHICCGSAGTYNMLNPALAQQLQARKAEHVEQVAPQVVAAGNIGCMEQIAGGTRVPVVHTVELLDWATGGPRPASVPRG